LNDHGNDDIQFYDEDENAMMTNIVN